ncbi:MAG: DUF3393 domain-containing protein [Nitrospirae bacterium]|nr:MAG: DUF3393 domain-containing protein [Nitrospirota bacterium]
MIVPNRTRSATLLLILATTTLSLSSGCETTKRVLDTAERAVTGRTGKTVIDIATSKDAEQALRKHVEGYARDPGALLKDLRAAQRDFETLMAGLRGEVGRTWGKKEVHLPDRKRYVKYTQNYRSRAIVDFDAGEILVETLDDTDPRGSLKNAVVTTLLTPNDPRAVDLFSDKGITLTSDKEPYLLGLVVDQTGKPVRTPAEAESFADWLLEKRSGVRRQIQDQPESCFRDHPDREQLQPLCRQFSSGLWTHAARARERRPRGLPQGEGTG